MDIHNVVCSIKEIYDDGKSFYEDPIKGDCIMYIGGFVLWPKKFVGKQATLYSLIVMHFCAPC